MQESKYMYVIPENDTDIVRYPDTGKLLPYKGGLVPKDNLWKSRVRSGIVRIRERKAPTRKSRKHEVEKIDIEE